MNGAHQLVDRLPRRRPRGGLGPDRHANSENPWAVPSQLAWGRGHR